MFLKNHYIFEIQLNNDKKYSILQIHIKYLIYFSVIKKKKKFIYVNNF